MGRIFASQMPVIALPSQAVIFIGLRVPYVKALLYRPLSPGYIYRDRMPPPIEWMNHTPPLFPISAFNPPYPSISLFIQTTMFPTQCVLLLLVGIRISVAIPLEKLGTRQTDIIEQAIAAQTFPEYVSPSLNRDITDWLAIGDSFSAGVSADVPNDQLNWACSRFKKSYPSQMNENERFPGFSTSRTFVFGACTGAKMQDVVDKQLEPGTPDLSADHPKIGNPQIGTVSISGNDLGFGDVRRLL